VSEVLAAASSNLPVADWCGVAAASFECWLWGAVPLLTTVVNLYGVRLLSFLQWLSSRVRLLSLLLWLSSKGAAPLLLCCVKPLGCGPFLLWCMCRVLPFTLLCGVLLWLGLSFLSAVRYMRYGPPLVSFLLSCGFSLLL
jgi:hypothetical protein